MLQANKCSNVLPSSKLINFGEIKVLRSEATMVLIILENKDYMTMMKEKLAEIKGVYRSLKLSPAGLSIGWD